MEKGNYFYLKCFQCNEKWNTMVYNPIANDYYDRPECLKCLNRNGDVWKKTSLLTSFYSNVHYLAFANYEHIFKIEKIFYSKNDPDYNKPNICVFRVNSELEISVAKSFLSKLTPNKDKSEVGCGQYDKGFFNTLRHMFQNTEICLTFILQLIDSKTNLSKLINDNFKDNWVFCIISTVNIRTLVDKDKFLIRDIYIE